MKLYIYSKKEDFTQKQSMSLEGQYDEIIFISENDYSYLLEDDSEKVIAIDPDIVEWQFPNEIIDRIQNVKAICLQSTGYEWVDCKNCSEKGIIVTNVPHYASNAVAEKSLFMALALAKKFPLFQKEGKMNWDSEFIGEDMWDKPTDIIGLGDIGMCLAKKLENIVRKKEICYVGKNKKDVDYLHESFDFILEKSEYMFVTCTKNKESIALFDDLSKFNKNMKVIIVANGFEEVAIRLAEKCEKGELGGVAFESDNLNREFTGNVFVTPHNAYYTKESLENMFEIWTNTILAAGTSSQINIINN
jgi:lactate dehydrogenase-like 2-hydroxyacid dehydrogenase